MAGEENRLERHGEEYQLNEAYNNVTLKQILVANIKDNHDNVNIFLKSQNIKTSDTAVYECLINRRLPPM